MSQKQRHRPRDAQHRVAAPPAKSVGTSKGLRLILLLLGLAGLVGGAWLVYSYWVRPGEGWPSSEPWASSSTAPSGPEALARRAREGNSKDQQLTAEVNHASELLSEGKAEEAVQVLTNALRLKPDDEDVHYNLGLALTRLGRFDQAIQEYNEALRIFPEYAEAHNNLGNLLMRTGDITNAIAHLERAVKVMPDYASAHNNLGTALQKAGRADEALPHFQQAVKLKPDYWEAHFNLGTGALQQGRVSDARSEFETVLRLRPDFAPAKSYLAAIDARQLPPSKPN